MERPVGVIGSGGHAKEILAALEAAGFVVEAIFDDNPERWGQRLWNIPICGDIAHAHAYPHLALFIAIGHNATRARIAKSFPDREWVTLIHPDTTTHSTAVIGPGTVIQAGAILQPDVTIGAHSIIDTGAIVSHDCQIGDYVHLAPGVALAGENVLEEGVFFGIGSSSIPQRRIGAWTTVGAGAVVVKDLPSHVVAKGVPAKVDSKTEKPSAIE